MSGTAHQTRRGSVTKPKRRSKRSKQPNAKSGAKSGQPKKRSVSGGDVGDAVELVDSPQDDGTTQVEEFLTNNRFQRIPVADACEQVVEEPMDLKVIAQRDGVWSFLDPSAVLEIWNTAELTRRSFCTSLTKNLFKLQKPHRVSLTRSLEEPTSRDMVGLYKNDDGKYVIIVRLPVNYDHQTRNSFWGGFASIPAAVVLATGGVLTAGYEVQMREILENTKTIVELRLKSPKNEAEEDYLKKQKALIESYRFRGPFAAVRFQKAFNKNNDEFEGENKLDYIHHPKVTDKYTLQSFRPDN
jgi:hypothetical protein